MDNQKRTLDPLGLELSCELPRGCRELNLRSFKEQPMRSLSCLSSPFFKLLETLLFYVNGYSGWLFVIWEDGTQLRKCWPDSCRQVCGAMFLCAHQQRALDCLGLKLPTSCEMLTPT